MQSRVVTVRIPAEQAEVLEDVSRFDGVSFAQEMREAVDLLIQARRQDPAFKDRVEQMLARGRQELSRIEGGAEVAKALE